MVEFQLEAIPRDAEGVDWEWLDGEILHMRGIIEDFEARFANHAPPYRSPGWDTALLQLITREDAPDLLT